ncbi:uncharacterized protein RHOBADRAFT_40745 [Rhodotorula graminis WP1]|uniref:Uncharacterized protein n=1 Tax=Rhodotorula graminis (strain WP1) TaxID=578459 RepID=A0A194SC72_RHOGW|nr:uncharacterized protein RHOBADRAFT_40745 [Rhodotorula graminis WP1]KPV78202.1 hypothetical protein RHOBADRAFT_40745 [Rhodotorula graminis WP1]
MGKVKTGRRPGASANNDRTPEQWTAFGGAPCQNRVDRWRTRHGFIGPCSHCEYLRKGGPAGVLHLAEIRRKRQAVVDQLAADAAAGLPPPPKVPLRYSKITKWPGEPDKKKEKKAEGKGKKAATASDSDDHDDAAKMNVSKEALDDQPVDQTIETPDFFRGTNVPFPKGDRVTVREDRKNVTLHKIYGCEREFNLPPPYKCSDCDEPMDYQKGDAIQYFIRRGQLIVSYHYMGNAHCRACKRKALGETEFPDGSEARAKGRIASLNKFRDDPLAYLNSTAKSCLVRIRWREKDDETPEGKRFENNFNNVADAQQAIAAALLKAVDPGMENGVPGNELITSRVLWFNKVVVNERLEAVMKIKSRITGRPMRWGVDDKNPATVSLDRIYSDLQYHDAEQLLQLIEWGWNCAFQDAPPEQRAEMLRVSFAPLRNVASAAMRVQEYHTPEIDRGRRQELSGTIEADEALVKSYGYSRSDALERWDKAADGHGAMKAVYAMQARRPTRLNRDGVLGDTVDKREWAGTAASDAEHAKAGRSFFVASGLICAVTGFKEDHALGLSLETDRLTDDMDYSAENCVVMFKHCNRFKGQLPHTKTLAKFLAFVKKVPHLKAIYDEQGLRYAVTQYVAEEMQHGPGLYPAVRADSSASSPEVDSSLEVEPDTAPSRSPSPELAMPTSTADLGFSPPSPRLPGASSPSASSLASSLASPLASPLVPTGGTPALALDPSTLSHDTSSASSSGDKSGLVAPSQPDLALVTVGGSRSSAVDGGLGTTPSQVDGDGDTAMATHDGLETVALQQSSSSAAGSTSGSGLDSANSTSSSLFGPVPSAASVRRKVKASTASAVSSSGGHVASGSTARRPAPVVNLVSKHFSDRTKARDEREKLPAQHFDKRGKPYARYLHLYKRDKHGYWCSV